MNSRPRANFAVEVDSNMGFSFIILALALAIFGQTQNEEDYTKINSSKLYGAATGPVRLTARGFAATLSNTTPVPATHYRIGCIDRNDDKLEIVRRDPLVRDDIYGNGFLTIETTHVVFPFNECSKGKLAVIEVIFADGTSWKLQP